MAIELLAAWGLAKAAETVFWPVLEKFAEDVVNDSAKDYVKDCFGDVFSALHRDALQKALGKALAELLKQIQEGLLDTGRTPEQCAAWVGDAKRFARSQSVQTAMRNLFTTSAISASGALLRTGWETSPDTDPLPDEFDWELVAKRFSRAVRNLREHDAELRAILQTQAVVETANDVKRLANLPPEFNLDGYRESLLEYHGNLKLELLDATGSSYKVRLWHIFVPQTVRNCDGYVPQLLEIPKEVQVKLRAQGEWDDALNRLTGEMLRKRRKDYLDQSPRPVLEVVNDVRNDKLVILGDPGSGKSTLLKAVALEWARIESATERQARTLPLLIELGPYDRWECPNGKSFVRYLQDAQTVHRLDQFRLDERLKQTGGAVLLLDGLDEIFDPNRRKAALNDIHRFSNDYPNTRIIVTSRVIGYEQRQLADAGFRHFMLQDLDEAQIHEFLEHWYTTFVGDARERTEKQDRLRRAVTESRAIRELAENPLLLTMMAILNLHQELPRDRVKLYERATELLLYHWDFERLGLKGAVEYREKAEMLRRLADHMQNAPEGLKGNIIDGDSLLKIFRDYLKQALELPNHYQVANDLVAQLRERNFILCHLGADKYAFVHRTMLEYFCASALVRQALRQPSGLNFLRDEVFAKHWQDETWHEVLRLIAGMDDQVPPEHVAALIDFLLEQKDRDVAFHHVFLAAQCYQEVRNPKLIPQSRQHLFQAVEPLLRYGHLANFREASVDAKTATQKKAVMTMAQATLPENPIAWLKTCATQDDDNVLREVAVQALARGWRDDPDTSPFLKSRATRDPSFNVRREALQALVRGWRDDPDTLPFLKKRATQDCFIAVRQAVEGELARGWKDDPEVQKLLEQNRGRRT